MKLKLIVGLSVAALFVNACGIPKEEHQKTLDELAKTQQDLASSKADTEKCTGKVGALENENKSLGGELTKASTNVANLQENLQQASGDLAATKGDLAATKAELDNLRKQRELAEKRMKTFRDMALKLKSMVDSGKLQVQIRKGKMIVKLADNVLFAPGSAAVKKEGKTALAEVAAALKDIKDRDFVIAGHTDNVPVKSARFPSNWELSTQRAVEVVKFLAAEGVEAAHLSAAGYSEFDPISPNDTPENRQMNRRLEIIVMPNIEELPKLDDAQ